MTVAVVGIGLIGGSMMIDLRKRGFVNKIIGVDLNMQHRNIAQLCGIVDEEILTALGHLPEYPTCSKAVCWHGIRCTVNFAWPIEPSLQYGSAPCSGLLFLCNWIG